MWQSAELISSVHGWFWPFSSDLLTASNIFMVYFVSLTLLLTHWYQTCLISYVVGYINFVSNV